MKDLIGLSTFLYRCTEQELKYYADSINTTQYRSKQWLVDTLKQRSNDIPKSPHIVILGSWFGSYLVPMLEEAFSPTEIILVDIDSNVIEWAKHLHQRYKCRFVCSDVEKDIDEISTWPVDIVINTSCEHMFDMTNVTFTSNPLYVFQACNSKTDPGHINPHTSTNHLVQSSGLKNVLFQGRLDLGHKSRFMVLGFK